MLGRDTEVRVQTPPKFGPGLVSSRNSTEASVVEVESELGDEIGEVRGGQFI